MSEITLEAVVAKQKLQDDAIASLIEANKTLAEQNEALKKVVSSATTIETAAKKELPKLPEENLKHKGKEFRWTIPVFTIVEEGEEPILITAAAAATDEKIIAKILSVKGQNILLEVV
ncbi:hypothetical protein ACFOWM_03520 [Ferruginibacter yonginensis]|uniref:Uncharacterized protein n=1 Tax=Ferruginibacter yonginensis TaxID=1310416 RepID=A0ABV8QQ49_9BACT